MLHTFSFLTLVAATVVAASNPTIVPQVIYQKLEDALFSNSSLLYMIQEKFISSKISPQGLVHLHVCVTVGSMQPLSCENSIAS